MYLQALDVEPNDDDTLCNLAMVLQRINYLDFAKIAYEEGIKLNPGNKILLHNFLLFLLEIQSFDQFTKVQAHAKRVLDKAEIENLTKLRDEYQKALGVVQVAGAVKIVTQNTGGASALSDNKSSSASGNKVLKGNLKSFFGKRKEAAIKFQSSGGIEEAENEEDDG
ncbi:hypothetical protein FGO68_gene16407 [Halteria grandinella]|uniref:Tetratricopeptide repeat protein n=1 Tax=Halteria grandinella TaxID=5974 RepID=A0A8J8NBU3_HALGN|nr:hypothetical protein FGO68_gene16407 [Halteria grandinella]